VDRLLATFGQVVELVLHRVRHGRRRYIGATIPGQPVTARDVSPHPASEGKTVSMGRDDHGSADTDGDRPPPFDLPLQPPIDPMLAKLARSIPDGDGWLFEPKWDGFRCLVFRAGDRLELFSRQRRPLTRYFPELVEPLRAALPPRCVVDGEIVVPDADGRGLDFDALLQRIHPAASRVERLAAETPARVVAFDLLALGDVAMLDRPMLERRDQLLAVVRHGTVVSVTPATRSRSTAAEWFDRFEGAGLDGVIAKPIDGTYQPGKRTLVKVKHDRTADCAVAGYRVHKDGQGVGSLLLGLFDDHGDLRSVGVAAAFTASRRRELLAELAPRLDGALDGHPWRDWAEWSSAAGDSDRSGTQVGGSRWNAGKDLSFVPIRMGLVAEVRFGQLEGHRFRHGVTFLRWRPDRTPESCRFDQLDVAEPVDFDDFLATARGA
jgi:ATP-dependent DNA ligase